MSNDIELFRDRIVTTPPRFAGYDIGAGESTLTSVHYPAEPGKFRKVDTIHSVRDRQGPNWKGLRPGRYFVGNDLNPDSNQAVFAFSHEGAVRKVLRRQHKI